MSKYKIKYKNMELELYDNEEGKLVIQLDNIYIVVSEIDENHNQIEVLQEKDA